MRNLKKFLALVLAMMMTLSLMVTVNAATTNNKFDDKDIAEATFAEDIQVLTGMDIIKGLPGGNFGYKNDINRHQMATFLYRITTGDVEGTQVDYWATYNTFKDVNLEDSYAGYIGYCQYAGLIKGYPDGTFKPMSKLTGYQALAMILRAIGYNEDGHNFTGDNWLMDISNTTTTNKLLVSVNNTVYKNRLYQPATRELVAELVFQGILQPQVRWTSAFGYQPYGDVGGVVGSTLNPSLGQAIFGLTRNTGIIVGNAETGEGEHVTKIGFSLNTTPVNSLGNFTIDGTTGDITGGLVQQTGIVTSIDDTVSVYAEDTDGDSTDDAWSSGYVYENDATDLPHNVTRAFQWDSKLDQFGHKVDVWYNCNSNKTVSVGNGTKTAKFTTDLQTYAVFDRNVSSNIVKVDTVSDTTFPSNTYWNYAFGPNFAAAYSKGAAANTAGYVSPILKNNYTDYNPASTNGTGTTTTTAHPLYLVVNNGDGVGMVVALDLTITQISQANNTKAPLTVGVNNGKGTSVQYFGFEDDRINGTGNTDYTNILQSSLVGDSDTTLGDNVAAILITGTNPGTGNPAVLKDGIDALEDNEGNYPNEEAAPQSSTYYHMLKKLTKVERRTIVEVNTATNSLYYVGGDGALVEIKQSPLAGAVANNRNLAYSVNDNVKFTQALMGPAEVTVTFDENGDYIYWEPDTGTSKFVYATYLDYTTELNSSTYKYSITTVQGSKEKLVENVVSYNGTAFTTANAYEDNILPKRDATVLSGTVKNGQYVGYILSGTALTAVTPANTAGSTSGTAANPMVQADDGDFADVTYTDADGATVNGLNIVARDVTIGAKLVQSGLYMTNNTVIHLVGGAGMDNQTLVTYNGIDELLGDHAEVIIHSGEATNTYPGGGIPFPFVTGIDYADMIYYKQSPFTYAQNYEESAMQVDEIYIPVACVETIDSVSGNVFFVGSNRSTMADAARNTTKYTVYNMSGDAQSVWINGLEDTASTEANVIKTNGKNVFYRLLDTGRKAWDNTPIYTFMAYNGAGVIGQYWDAATDAVTGTKQVTTNPGTAPAKYMATTYESQAAFIDTAADITGGTADLFNVGNAKVVNLDKVTYPGIVDGNLTSLNNAGSIYNNETVPVSCVLENAAVVSVIFVNA